MTDKEALIELTNKVRANEQAAMAEALDYLNSNDGHDFLETIRGFEDAVLPGGGFERVLQRFNGAIAELRAFCTPVQMPMPIA